MAVPEVIIKLIERFDILRSSYIYGNEYNETKLRQDYLDHFFIALGWDVYNKQGWSEKAREVSVEQPIKISGTTDFIDYSFKIGRDLVFIAEAKAPKIRIKDNLKAAHQVRSYAWNAKLPLCILTNFDEFAIYDCTKKPSPSDPAGYARIEYFTFRDLAAKWDDLVKTFSKDAVFNGSFDAFAKTTKGKKGTASVDEAFLIEIEGWRESLAKNIMLRNRDPPLNVDELNYAVQVIIDRIIFLQNCEDRGLEPFGTLKAILDFDNVYLHLCELFKKADNKYNSGIFYFEKESDREEPDVITPRLKIDDKVLKAIIHELSEGPYEFSVIPPAILGQVYEQFLGKVIRITDGLNAKVDDKPEVKKAGGVFYTPQYIVEYIVKHTVRELVEGKTSREVAKIRILDPACGSGSFLLGAYQSLLDWHLEWYVQNLAPLLNQDVPISDPRVQTLLPEPLPRKKKLLNCAELPIYRTGYNEGINKLDRTRSDWGLSTSEKKRILINNIFGVDIDRQAVEVTKLSLLLKVLEGEKEENLDKQLKISDERALPSLHHNIKCGNSLIGTDICTPEMPFEEVKRINPFDWDREFADVMKAGGFDAVIGNPPYIRIQTLKEWAPTEVEFYKKKFFSASKGNYDIYVVFVEKGLSLLNKNGLLGYILPHKFFNAQYGSPLRTMITKGKHLNEIVHFGHQQVFENATTYTCLLFLKKGGKETFSFGKIDDLKAWSTSQETNFGSIPAKSATSDEWNFVVGNNAKLFERLNNTFQKLGDLATIFVGVQTSADNILILDFVREKSGNIILKSKSLNSEFEFETDLFHPLVSGTDVKRYISLSNRQYLLFPYSIQGGLVNLIDFKEIEGKYPKTADYLLKNKKTLESREKGKMKGEKWYGYIYLKNMAKQSIEKICVPRLVDRLYATYDVTGNHFLDNVDVGGIALTQENKNLELKYLLGFSTSLIFSLG